MNGPISSAAPRVARHADPSSYRNNRKIGVADARRRPNEYDATRVVIIHAPQSGIEWLWTFDLIELSWDIQRYRTLRHNVLEAYRQRAIEEILNRIDTVGIPSGSREMARRQTHLNAAHWHDDSAAAIEIEIRLAYHGYDAKSIDMEVFVQARELFIMFDSLMHSAQNRRVLLLREINGRRLSASKRIHLSVD
jgi:hypothetical protein